MNAINTAARPEVHDNKLVLQLVTQRQCLASLRIQPLQVVTLSELGLEIVRTRRLILLLRLLL